MKTLTEKVKEAVFQQTSFLSGQNEPSLEELLERSKSDRRVRNVTPLYALLFHQDKWRKLIKENRDVFYLQLHFKKALLRLEKSDSETSLIAKELKESLLPKGKTYMLMNRNDASQEMAKLLQSLVRSIKLEESMSVTTRNMVENKLKKVDFNNLFTPHKQKLL